MWFQRASDVVRKLRYGDIDLGIVGADMFEELADGDSDLVVCHDALGFGQCHLALGVPMTGEEGGRGTGRSRTYVAKLEVRAWVRVRGRAVPPRAGRAPMTGEGDGEAKR